MPTQGFNVPTRPAIATSTVAALRAGASTLFVSGMHARTNNNGGSYWYWEPASSASDDGTETTSAIQPADVGGAGRWLPQASRALRGNAVVQRDSTGAIEVTRIVSQLGPKAARVEYFNADGVNFETTDATPNQLAFIISLDASAAHQLSVNVNVVDRGSGDCAFFGFFTPAQVDVATMSAPVASTFSPVANGTTSGVLCVPTPSGRDVDFLVQGVAARHLDWFFYATDLVLVKTT